MNWFDLNRIRSLLNPQNKRLVQYLIVGVIGVGINQAVFLALFNYTIAPYFIAGFLGSVISVFANYVMNDSWTWRYNGAAGIIQWIWRGIKYAATRIVGMGIGTVAQILLVEILLISPAASNILKIGVGAIWGFGASEKWVWKSTKSSEDKPTSETSSDN